MKQIIIRQHQLNVLFVKTKNKHSYIYFNDGYIEIRLSLYQTEKDAIKYLERNIDYIIKNVTKKEYLKQKELSMKQLIFGKEKTKDQRELEKTFPSYKWKYYLNNLLKQELERLINKYHNNPYIDITNVVIKIKDMKSRYGSCNSKTRRISINSTLIHYDKKIIEYVFLHEITHLVVQNHSQQFYNLLSKLCPHHRQLRRQLKYYKE